MDDEKLLHILDESAKLEENVAHIYLLLSRLYTEDSEFWLQLHNEELSHSTIFKLFLHRELPLSLLPADIVEKNLNIIKKNNQDLATIFPSFLSTYKKKLDAYRFALHLEELATENTFQQLIIHESDSENLYLIQRLNKDSINHKARIEELIVKTEEHFKNAGYKTS